jgi:photosystem II stability/assembly factor-like uncharacterized protein
MLSRSRAGALVTATLSILILSGAPAPLHPGLYSDMRWRMIGPFRGGRTVAADGIPDQPNVFVVAANNGGVWKSTDFGHVWKPIFDDQPTGSIGALAIAPSNPDIIYVGSGEGLQRPDLSVGDGMYKTADGGKTWQHLGLRDGQQIPAILVDPRDPQRLWVAVLGHPYGPNAERGVFRSTNGGQSFEKVLYKDENTGAIDLAMDPHDPNVLYAVLWSARQGPWENGAWQGPASGLYRSTDSGTTWAPIGKGLPSYAQGLGRMGIAIAPSNSRRMYAWVDARPGGIFKSDDAGENWSVVNNEARVWGRGSDFACVRVDPRNPDRIYVANTSTYLSEDAGKTFKPWKGAPGGDDYHTIWINPKNPAIVLLAVDQGATITVNGGDTWSSWYNQPTAQFYHVSTDNRFPYWVYGGQQESGSAGVASRSDYGEITFRDWHPVGVEEYGYVAPDPLNPGIIYGGKVTRFDEKTGEVQQVGPVLARSGKYRFLRTAPLVFSPVDPHKLFFAGNVLFQTVNGGNSWNVISPDLTRESYELPASIGFFRDQAQKDATRRGVIYTIAPSYKDVATIWVGTDDGLIHVTKDAGKTWRNVTPPDLGPWSKVSVMDASRFDAQSAYAAVNRFRCDDLKPYIYRTHDGGNTWQSIVHGLPDDPINAVREDPVRKGLLFAGSERAVYVSFNDGDDWQPLRLNMPATSIRDIVIHDDDLVAGTHGRGFWILDNLAPLRQLNEEVAGERAHLFQPPLTYRVRRNQSTDTPLPPEEPAGQNPPDGAILDYYLSAATPVTLEIFDSARKLVRRFSSDDKPEVTLPELERELHVPTYWVRLPKILSGEAGMHRFVWDLHYPPPDGGRRDYPISAIYHDTPRYPLGPVALPGAYTVKLTAGGQSFTQPLIVKIDPRIKTPQSGLAMQFHLATRICDLMGKAKGKPALARLNGELGQLLAVIEGSDSMPTTQAVAAVNEAARSVEALLKADVSRPVK